MIFESVDLIGLNRSSLIELIIMANWENRIDKGPRIGDDDAKHQRKRGKKVFTIEQRYIGPNEDPAFAWILKREWHTYRSYETEMARQNAWRSLKNRGTKKQFEYRIGAYDG